MKREEAIAVLKEMVDICERIGVKHISLKHVAEGYELHIEDHFDEYNSECLQDILQKHNLNMKKHNNKVVIYTPKNT